MKKTTLIALAFFLFTSCHKTPSSTNSEVSDNGVIEKHVWNPDPSTEMPCTQDMKTWTGKPVKNTALAGKWYVDTRRAGSTPKGISLDVGKDGCFKISLSSKISDEELHLIQGCFSERCQKGGELKGHVRCHDNWCAGGEGPDASCEVGFFDENGKYLNAFAFVYCQINDNEFTFDNLWGSNIFFSLIPATRRSFKRLVYPKDYE